MLNIGDIVSPKVGLIGDNYTYKISKIINKLNDDFKFHYNIKLINKENLEIDAKSAENFEWTENELTLISRPTALVKAMNSDVTTISINGEGIRITNNKEENIMDILRIYEERRRRELKDYFKSETDNVKRGDAIQEILADAETKANAILKSENNEIRVDLSNLNYFTQQTDDKIHKLKEEYRNQERELDETLEEVAALFGMTDDYTERMKILKRYDIIGKDGKLLV